MPDTYKLVKKWLCYHNCLLDQNRTVFTHVLEDLVGCIASRHTGRFAGNCQGINQGLGMMFTNVYQKVMNEPSHQSTWSVNTGYQLRDHLYQHIQYMNPLCGHLNGSQLCVEWALKSVLWLFDQIFSCISKHKKTYKHTLVNNYQNLGKWYGKATPCHLRKMSENKQPCIIKNLWWEKHHCQAWTTLIAESLTLLLQTMGTEKTHLILVHDKSTYKLTWSHVSISIVRIPSTMASYTSGHWP